MVVKFQNTCRNLQLRMQMVKLNKCVHGLNQIDDVWEKSLNVVDGGTLILMCDAPPRKFV